MNRTSATLSKVLVVAAGAGALAAVCLVGTPAQAQWAPPPPEFIATTEPVYYEGHAAYWYGNHWYYRDDRGGWGHYDNEPAFLHDRRGRMPPVRRGYEHPAGHRR